MSKNLKCGKCGTIRNVILGIDNCWRCNAPYSAYGETVHTNWKGELVPSPLRNQARTRTWEEEACTNPNCYGRGYAVGSKCWNCGRTLNVTIRYIKRTLTWGFLLFFVFSLITNSAVFGSCFDYSCSQRNHEALTLAGSPLGIYILLRIFICLLSPFTAQRRDLRKKRDEDKTIAAEASRRNLRAKAEKERMEFLGRMTEVERAQFLHNERMEALQKQNIDIQRRQAAMTFWMIRNNQSHHKK